MKNIRKMQLVSCLFTAFFLGGCESVDSPVSWETRTEKHGREVDLLFHANHKGLSRNQQERIRAALANLKFGTPLHGEIYADRPETPLTRARIKIIRDYLSSQGLKARQIHVRQNQANSRIGADHIKLVLDQYEAVPPRCQGWVKPMRGVFGVESSPEGESNFGCVSEANLARMIADPKDLVDPRKLEPGDGAYHTGVIRKWRAGRDKKLSSGHPTDSSNKTESKP